MKKLLKRILNNKDIIDLTADKKPYSIKAQNAKPPYVVYTIIDEFGSEFAENTEIATRYNIQVDIFSKNDFDDLKEKIIKIMNENEFYRNGGNESFESDTGLYHCVLRFNYTKERI